MCMNVTRCDSVSSGVGTTPTQPGTMHVDSACNVCESLCPMLRCDLWSWNHPNRTKHSCEVIGVTPWACTVPSMLYMCSCFSFCHRPCYPLYTSTLTATLAGATKQRSACVYFSHTPMADNQFSVEFVGRQVGSILQCSFCQAH